MKEYEQYLYWLNNSNDEISLELKQIENNTEEINDRFYRNLEFGTGGLRGVIGAGTNRINIYTVAKATWGLSNYLLNKYGGFASVVVGYDSRIKSDEFAKTTAAVFAERGITLNPVPTVSFATRYLNASAGVMITASHNPAKYNGYKVYGADGCQITTEAAKEIYEQIESTDIFKDIDFGNFENSVASGKIEYITDDVLEWHVKRNNVIIYNIYRERGNLL